MKILIIPDSFKGSASNVEVAHAIADGMSAVLPQEEYTIIPFADGGEGSLEAIHSSLGGRWINVQTVDPLRRPHVAHYLRVKDTAFIELAKVAGLPLLDRKDRDPEKTTTSGVGIQIDHAVRDGVHDIILCIGGSATNDGATGIAHAMGYRFIDERGQEFFPVGGNLQNISKITPPDNRPHVSITILSDVNNPFTGRNGATCVYSPQKGAGTNALLRLEKGMEHLRQLFLAEKGIDLNTIPGSGAAGGVGGGMKYFFDAELKPGVDYLMDVLKVERNLLQADLIITGEGRIDSQTNQGKLISGICRLAKKYDKPVIAICGIHTLSFDETKALGLTSIFSILKDFQPAEKVYHNTPYLIREISSHIGHTISKFKNG